MLSEATKKTLKTAANGSEIMASGTKVSTEDLIGKDLTIEDYDRIDTVNERTKEPEHFYAVRAAELPDNYFLSGSALTSLIDGAENSGEDIRGEKIRHQEKVRTKSGNTFTPVMLL